MKKIFLVSMICLTIAMLMGCSMPSSSIVAQDDYLNLYPEATQHNATKSPRPTSTPSPTPIMTTDSTLNDDVSPTDSTSTLLPVVSHTPVIELDIHDFLPTENAYVKYEVLLDKNNALQYYTEYSKEKSKQHFVQNRIRYKKNDDKVEVLRCDETSLTRVYQNNSVVYSYNHLSEKNTEDILLQAPVIPGTSWNITSGTSTITSINVGINTPLGLISAVEVSTLYQDGATRRSYYAPGFGLVAQYDYDTDENLVAGQEIQEREINKGFSQTISFFYIDQATQTLEHIQQDITFTPNTDMRKVFAEKLASVPSSSNLLPLSSSVKINSIKVAKKSVHVDFSEELVTQMNLPVYTERLLFQALANTFCEYYNVSRLYITIDGSNYISRTVTLFDDDYLTPDFSSVP